jgi:hypothetical protein
MLPPCYCHNKLPSPEGFFLSADFSSSLRKQQLGPAQGALAGVGAGVLYGLLGFMMATLSPRMGNTLFLFLPLVVGITIALVTPRPILAAAMLSTTVSLLICLIFLIAMKAEGILCAIMAFPLIFLALLIGIALGWAIRQVRSPGATTSVFILAVAPAVIVGGNRLEMKSFTSPRTQSVTTTVHLSASPHEVWANILSIDQLIGRKPILMHFGLPVPQRCVMSGRSVGSKRTCYFDQGYIEESVLEWNPPQRMRLAIDRTHMPGRHWLQFDGAEYDLQGDSSGTTLTRITIIRSNLQPAWYWGPLEKWGVESVHAYLFSDLEQRFNTKR